MIRQHAISAKIDRLTWAWLCAESERSGLPRNRIINKALVMYIRVMAARRRMAAQNLTREEVQRIGAIVLGLESFNLFEGEEGTSGGGSCR